MPAVLEPSGATKSLVPEKKSQCCCAGALDTEKPLFLQLREVYPVAPTALVLINGAKNKTLREHAVTS